MFNFRAWAKEKKAKIPSFQEDLWKNIAIKSLKKDDLVLIIEQILQDSELDTRDKRVQKFMQLTRKSQATYYRLLKIHFKMEERKEKPKED